MRVLEKELREFLKKYIDDPQTCKKAKKDMVFQEEVDCLVIMAVEDHVEQEIIDYGTAHPEAHFRKFLDFLKPGDFTDGEDDDDE